MRAIGFRTDTKVTDMTNAPEQDRVLIFDTTLRDGEQSPGATMTHDEKLEIAELLDEMGVDIIEAGFPIASEGDFRAVTEIAKRAKNSRICGLARANFADIDRCAEAIKHAELNRIHTFIGTSPLHRAIPNLTMDEMADKIHETVTHARNLTENVQWSPMDATRTEWDYLCRVIEIAIKAGATTINIPDTVGYAVPEEFGHTIGQLIERIPNSDKAIFSVHCHNDLGLAVANSLAAVQAGARQVECTINGLGERAGNASLEEFVMALRTRKDILGLETGIDTTQIVPASRLISSVTGFPVQPNKAIVGANAFAHESGIHQDGVLKHRETYEIMTAQDVGWNANKMVMGKHSGRAAFRSRLEELGTTFATDAELNAAFGRFKELADKKHEIFDEDLVALVSDARAIASSEHFKLVSLSVNSQTGETPLAQVTVDVNGQEMQAQAEGSGPVDAAFKAIEAIANSESSLQLYSVNAITEGTDSQGEVTVRLEKAGRIVNGLGADTDIIIASAKAYIHALNMLDANVQKAHPQV